MSVTALAWGRRRYRLHFFDDVAGGGSGFSLSQDDERAYSAGISRICIWSDDCRLDMEPADSGH